MARQTDDGFDPRMFTASPARIQRCTHKQFAAYGLTAAEAASLRERFADWQRELIGLQDENPAGYEPQAATVSSPRQQPVWSAIRHYCCRHVPRPTWDRHRH
ncbi:hypothetical protein OG426_37115 [Streptomyces canus]|uniref:hypothetical protein n=1 Tax=Streptomyces canus TaxID=58343 RepID=UPI003868967D|nr:hypothetical protein OG426_37115 [Streptomyces canus]